MTIEGKIHQLNFKIQNALMVWGVINETAYDSRSRREMKNHGWYKESDPVGIHLVTYTERDGKTSKRRAWLRSRTYNDQNRLVYSEVSVGETYREGKFKNIRIPEIKKPDVVLK